MNAQEHRRRAAQAKLIAERMTLTALRWDEAAFDVAWNDMHTIRENELDTLGCSDVLCRVVRILAGSAAGALLDLEESNGGDIESAELWLLKQISGNVGAADGGAA